MKKNFRTQRHAYLQKIFGERIDRQLDVVERELELALAKLDPNDLKVAKEYLRDADVETL